MNLRARPRFLLRAIDLYDFFIFNNCIFREGPTGAYSIKYYIILAENKLYRVLIQTQGQSIGFQLFNVFNGKS